MSRLQRYWQQWSTPGWQPLLLFKAGWLGLVLQPAYSAPLVLMLLCWALTRLQQSQRQTVFTIWAGGLLLDSVLVYSGLFQFSSVWLPYWLVLLWGWFSLFWLLLFSHWLQSSLAVALFGLLGGPLAYWGGAQLSASLQIMSQQQFWLITAPAWAALLLWARQTEVWWDKYHLQHKRSGGNGS